MSAPRPYETDRFHPPSSVPTNANNDSIYNLISVIAVHAYDSLFICNFHKSVPVNSSISYLHCVLVQGTFPIHACALPELLIPRFKAILKSFCRLQSGVYRLH